MKQSIFHTCITQSSIESRSTCTCIGITGTSVQTWVGSRTVNYRAERKYPKIENVLYIYQGLHLSRVGSTLKFQSIDSEFVKRELEKIDVNKAVGLDDLHPRLLKIAAPFIAEPLSIVFNKSLSSGCFPSDFKRAKIIPVPKSSETSDIGNYRPISLSSCLSKILEKAVHAQLYEYLQEYKLLSQRQSGFRPKHSTATCLIEITDHLLNNIDCGLITGAIFLDLKKAFDVISHEILLLKMPYYGINSVELDWFSSYLTNRQQCVSFQGVQSNFLQIYSGVP